MSEALKSYHSPQFEPFWLSLLVGQFRQAAAEDLTYSHRPNSGRGPADLGSSSRETSLTLIISGLAGSHPRSTLTTISSPTAFSSTSHRRSSTCLTGVPLTCVMRSASITPPSPLNLAAFSPAAAAGLPGTTSTTSTPERERCSCASSERTTLSSATLMPMVGFTTRPKRMIWLTTRRTVSTGMANPMPTLPPVRPPGEMMAVLTPTSLPRESRSGPPELPGLMAASVWMQFLIARPLAATTSRPSAETTPCVSV
mmetsp:Transcript_11136/g.23777  ORF Transcript_11136/g.23777 Transcript_11136/m.23777 type:complete len:255 (+) Transcript_11136:35-799(+)